MAYISAKSSHAESVTGSPTRNGEVRIIKGELVVVEHGYDATCLSGSLVQGNGADYTALWRRLHSRKVVQSGMLESVETRVPNACA